MVNLLQNGNKTAKINVKNFHGSLTTVVRAQNDTSKTANISFSILQVERYTRPYQRIAGKGEYNVLHVVSTGSEVMLPTCVMKLS